MNSPDNVSLEGVAKAAGAMAKLGVAGMSPEDEEQMRLEYERGQPEDVDSRIQAALDKLTPEQKEEALRLLEDLVPKEQPEKDWGQAGSYPGFPGRPF